MKKDSLILMVALLFASFSQAQSIGETLQYSQQEILGTARYRALSGAFGALGGDLTALSENPAGSAVFNNSFGSVTLSSKARTNDVSYFGNTLSNKENNLNFNQLGAVFVFSNGNSGPSLNKVTLGLTYNQTADFRDEFVAQGLGTTSIASYFIEDAAEFAPDQLEILAGESFRDAYINIGDELRFSAQQAFLGLEANIITPDPDNSTPERNAYQTTLDTNGPFDQEYTYISTGFNGKFTANLGLQVAKDYYFGLNLNSHSATSTKTTIFSELDNDPDSEIDEVVFRNTLTSISSGFSLNLGAIAKISDQFRAGLSYESPTWYTIAEEFSQRLINIQDTGIDFIANPNTITILPDYQLRTPGKLTASAALIFGKQGLISIDYSYKDYSNTKFSDEFGEDFNRQNTAIKERFQATSTYRIGGEYRYENWSYRAGFRYEESPYKENLNNQAYVGDTQGFSIGAGYNFGKIKLDLAYDRIQQDRSQALYPTSEGFTNTTQVNNTTNSITATLGLNF